MGVTPPYLYTATSPGSAPDYSFDPKAVTRASYVSAASSTASPRPKREGPLIDFNRHPDSYVIVPYGRPSIPPMHPNTKRRIGTTRWALFALRLLQLLGSLGALVCVICIRGVNDAQGWVLRVPPAVDAVVCCYSMYHLRRPAKARPASSSAGYSAFSLFVDIGLIPFYVFIAFYSESNWSMNPGENGRWRSFFHDPGTGKLLLASFLIGSVVGALHLFSIPIDAYLLIIFRKIARFPPDMNPLEDNLTSRMSRKHRYKNSELTASISEKRFATLSGSTLGLSNPSRDSIGKDQLVPEANVRPISFYQSRANLDSSYSSHTPETARLSRFEYQQPASNRASQVNIDYESRSRYRSRSRSSRPQSQGQASYYTTDHEQMLPRPLSFVTASENNSRQGTPQPGPQASVPAATAKDQQKQSLLNDNWYVLGDDDADLSSPRRTSVPDLESDHDDTAEYHEPNDLRHRLTSSEVYQDLLPQPLRMQPPTPPRHSSDHGDFYFDDMGKDTGHEDGYVQSNEETIGRALTTPVVVSDKPSLYSQSTPDVSRTGTPKGKMYGDLASAMKNIRGHATEQSVPRAQGRVVSRSGVDIADVSVMYDNDDTRGNRRHVSGRAAEEGFGGEWTMRKREVSGFA